MPTKTIITFVYFVGLIKSELLAVPSFVVGQGVQRAGTAVPFVCVCVVKRTMPTAPLSVESLNAGVESDNAACSSRTHTQQGWLGGQVLFQTHSASGS